MKSLSFLTCFTGALFLSACGGDSTTSVDNSSLSSSSEWEASSSSEKNATTQSSSSGNVEQDRSSSSQDSFVKLSSSSEAILSSGSKTLASNYDPATGLLTDERDGSVYKTAKVGNQIWMAQNLRLDNPKTLDDCSSNYYDYTIKDEAILQKFGHHYGWITAMQISCGYEEKLAKSEIQQPHQGLCPTGWHIPSIDEWQELFNAAPLTELLSTDWKMRYFVGTDDYGLSLNEANEDEENVPEFLAFYDASSTKNYVVVLYCEEPSKPIKVETKSKTSIFAYLRCLMD